ncbi:FAD-binding oxidoreductase [Aliiroseovarius sp. S1339]|uniref:FAD-binding oxidoreductase n=1 Tax=Aliiroseovarius sp. S1339 TaxID=2936990 RepID=UPI0020BEA156|nr:FAD-binding oxidoreductase [Aliiroseovarius sp. S1339]MCK8464360.1 FAD-binding oxidoreductase [Aliiroseovarius sp. S1339]
MDLLERLRKTIGEAHVLTGADTAPWASDWLGKYHSAPMAVLRPGTTADVQAVMAIAHETGTPVVPVSGNTSLSGGTQAPAGSLVLSLSRMNRIRDIRPEARLAVVDGGVVLVNLQTAVASHGLSFPMSFGAKGSCMIAGMLATNAGGSNVVRHGNTRDLCIGIEAVLPNGELLDLMSELHKDNSGYDLRDLLIGSEGTLAIITGAVLKLVPAPKARATAMLAVKSLGDALAILNQLQDATGRAVEAFEYMPDRYFDALAAKRPDFRPPFADPHAINILAEIGSTVARDATHEDDGSVPLNNRLEEVLAGFMEDGAIIDAVIAQNDAQRAQMWESREAAAEVILSRHPLVNNDIALPLDRVEAFLTRMGDELTQIDPLAEVIEVAHLGDGNIHYTVFPSDAALADPIMERVEEVTIALGGSFSAEHGIGLSKLPSMRRRKDRVALAVMRQVKQALDPKGIMNPGKMLPD